MGKGRRQQKSKHLKKSDNSLKFKIEKKGQKVKKNIKKVGDYVLENPGKVVLLGGSGLIIGKAVKDKVSQNEKVQEGVSKLNVQVEQTKESVEEVIREVEQLPVVSTIIEGASGFYDNVVNNAESNSTSETTEEEVINPPKQYKTPDTGFDEEEESNDPF